MDRVTVANRREGAVVPGVRYRITRDGHPSRLGVRRHVRPAVSGFVRRRSTVFRVGNDTASCCGERAVGRPPTAPPRLERAQRQRCRVKRRCLVLGGRRSFAPPIRFTRAGVSTDATPRRLFASTPAHQPPALGHGVPAPRRSFGRFCRALLEFNFLRRRGRK